MGDLSDLADGENQASRLERSRDRYIKRKRALQQHVVMTGMDMIGKRVSIFDEAREVAHHPGLHPHMGGERHESIHCSYPSGLLCTSM